MKRAFLLFFLCLITINSVTAQIDDSVQIKKRVAVYVIGDDYVPDNYKKVIG